MRIVVVLLLAFAGCSRPSATTTSVQTTTTRPQTLPSPTPLIGTGGADCSDIRVGAPLTRVDAAPEATVCLVRKADPPIAAVLEKSIDAVAGPEPPPFYVELFTRGAGGWELLADLSKIPADEPLVGAPGQIVEVLKGVDFDGDGTDSLVIGVLSVGASSGPLDVTVLSFRGVDVAVDLQVGTQSGGAISIEGREVVIESGSYEPGDPRCCPSGIVTRRIGWNATSKRVEVIAESVTPVTTRP